MAQPSGDGFWSGIRQSLEENPLLLVYAGAGGFVLLILIVVIVLLVSGGGGGSDDIVSGRTPTPSSNTSPTATAAGGSSTTTATPSGPLPAVTDVAPELNFFGDLAAVNDYPVTTTFSTTADSVDLPDGSTLEVPEGAFSAPTAVTVAIIDLEYDKFLSTPPDGRIYVLSTELDITLGAPIVLEVPKPSDSVFVGEFAGGAWTDLPVEPGDTTRIEFDHFSDHTIGVSDDTSTNPLHLKEKALLDNDVARNLLGNCMSSVGYLLGEPKDPTGVLLAIVFEVCAQALADEPLSSDRVNLQCVSDNLDQGVESAIDGCEGGTATSTPTPTPTPTPSQQTPKATPTPTKKAVSGTLAPGVLSSSAVLANDCFQLAEGDDITCTYNITVTLDYTVSELPAEVRCAIQPQIPNYNPIEPGIVQLNSESGIVSVTARATGVYDAESAPLFSTPTLVECVLRRPIGAGEFNGLDSILVDVALPGPS